MNGRSLAQLVTPPMVVVLVWFGVGWLPAALSPHTERRLAAEDERSLLIGDLADSRTLPADVPDIKERLVETAVAVPPTVDLAVFVRATDAAGDRAGIFIEQMAPLTVSGDNDEEALSRLPIGASSVTISIGASGAYDKVMAFADELLAMDRLVVIDLIDLNTDEEDTSQIILDLELRIFTTQRLIAVPELDEELFDEPMESDEGTAVGTIEGMSA